MSKHTHYFLALPLPPHIRSLLTEWKELLEQRFSFRSWVHPQDLHITLCFLGSVSSFSQMSQLKKQVKSIAEIHQPLELSIDVPGTFGSPTSPRIFWAGVKESQDLRSLQQQVYNACINVGFELEKRPFTPHITLARKRTSPFQFKESDIREMVRPKEEHSSYEVNQMVLYQTHLDRMPRYQPLSVFQLGHIGE
ncbi:RNA 2',3'-cyclic phosphodiesterase [Bacillus timonensis]|nr:RNA 2',3'-cyclic phosphodiesterase [Bacillus timonensis]